MPRQIPSQFRFFRPIRSLCAGVVRYGDEAAIFRAVPFARQGFARASDSSGSDSIQPWFENGGAK
jgi:hypothetical protein